MRVLFITQNPFFEIPGGSEIQILKTRKALEQKGVTVHISAALKPQAEGFDLVHLFGIGHLPQVLRQVFYLRKNFNLPLVLSPIWWDLSESIRAEVVFKSFLPDFLRNPSSTWDSFQKGELIPKGMPEQNFNLPPRTVLAELGIAFLVDYFLPNSETEMKAFTRYFSLLPPYRVAYNAVEAETFLNASPEWFIKEYGLKDFILTAGRLCPTKNQLALLAALKETDLPVVLIGQKREESYFQALKTLRGEKQLLILPPLNHQQLASAYQAAKIHILPSFRETPGLVNLEAALADCSIITTNRGSGEEYFGRLVRYCEPTDLNSIKNAVLSAFENYEAEAPQREKLKKLILEKYTWDKTACDTLEGYHKAGQIFKAKPRLNLKKLKPALLDPEKNFCYQTLSRLLLFFHPLLNRDKLLYPLEVKYCSQAKSKLRELF